MPLTAPRPFRFRRRSLGVILCITLFTASSALRAQDKLRRITGSVTNRQHEPLAAAVVQLHDDTTGAVISYITNRSGRYTFQRVSQQDDYHLWATYRGHKSRSRSISKFDSKSDRRFALVVKLE